MAVPTPLARMMFSPSPSQSFTSRPTPASPFTPSVAQTFIAGLGAGVTLSPSAPDWSPPSAGGSRPPRGGIATGLATVSEDQLNTPSARRGAANGADTERAADELSVAHSQRFRAVLAEAVERLDLLGLITLDATRRREMPQARSRKDIFSLMIQQKSLEEKFETLMAKRGTLGGMGSKKKMAAHQAELAELTESLRASTAAISQNLKDQPTIVGNLNKIQKDRGQLQSLLFATMIELKNQTFESLVKQVEQRAKQSQLLTLMLQSQELAAERLKKLDAELDAECDRFDDDLKLRNATIQELTIEHKELKKNTSLTSKFEEESARARAETLERQRRRREIQLRESIVKVRAAKDKDQTVHRLTVEFLEQQKGDLDRLHREWQQRYEREYSAKSQEFNELDHKRNSDKKKLVELQVREAGDKDEKTAKAAEDKKRSTEEANKSKLLHLMNLAQCKIRFAWRVYWRRKQLLARRRARLRRLRRLRKLKEQAAKFPYLPQSRSPPRSTRGAATAAPATGSGAASARPGTR